MTYLMNDDPINIDYVANLARIELTEEEKEKFSGQLSQVLEYFEKLSAIDVSGVEPTAHAFPIFNVWAEDEVEPGFTPEQALSNAPAQRKDQIVVPKVVDEAGNAS